MILNSTFRTQNSKAHLSKLCRMFARKVPVSMIQNKARIEFETGICRIESTASHLCFYIEATHTDLAKPIQKSIEEHLEKAIKDNNLAMIWQAL